MGEVGFDLREYEDLLFSDDEGSLGSEEEEVEIHRPSTARLRKLTTAGSNPEGLRAGTSSCLPTKKQSSSCSSEPCEVGGRRTSMAAQAVGGNSDGSHVRIAPHSIVSSRPRGIYMGRQRCVQRELPSLVNLCVGVLGKHLEEIIPYADMFVHLLPTSVRLSLAAVARRRGLLCDSLLMALAEDTWEVLDVSKSAVTDEGMDCIARLCPRLKAVDISQCRKLTMKSIEALVEHCPQIHTLRCGGDAVSDGVVREAMWCLLPQLTAVSDNVEALDWEDLDDAKVGKGAQSLVYLVWPTVDAASSSLIKAECPKIVLLGQPSSEAATPSVSGSVAPAPKPTACPRHSTSSSSSPTTRALSSRMVGERSLPLEANASFELDERFVESIDPSSWAERGGGADDEEGGGGGDGSRRGEGVELSIAERFRLAYISRDERLAPKRAKNARQMQRRVMRAWLKGDTDAKSRLLASMAERSLLSKGR